MNKIKSIKNISKIISNNKKAYYDYAIIDQVEAGIVLTGHEVKSLRFVSVSIQNAYANIIKNEVYILDFNVSRYNQTKFSSNLIKREKKLLLNN